MTTGRFLSDHPGLVEPSRRISGLRKLAAIGDQLVAGVTPELGQPVKVRFADVATDDFSLAELAAARGAIERVFSSLTKRPDARHFSVLLNENPWLNLGDQISQASHSAVVYGQLVADDIAAAAGKKPRFEATEDYVAASKWVDGLFTAAGAKFAADTARLVVERLTPPEFKEKVGTWLAPRHSGATHRAETLSWMYALDKLGMPGHDKAVLYRMQAQSIYGIAPALLADKEITAEIDRGGRINVMLADRLGTTKLGLAVTRELSLQGKFADLPRGGLPEKYLASAALFGIPPAEWQEMMGGTHLPGETVDGHAGPMISRGTAFVHRAFWSQTTEIADALASFEKDVIQPLLGHYGERGAMQIGAALHRLREGYPTDDVGRAAREFVRTVHRATVGDRRPSGFAKAADRTHGFAAAVSAARQEIVEDLSSWPALFAPWSTADGTWTFEPVTSATDLIAEGTAMGHCVGDYASQCRIGTTHIVSVRCDGKRVGTLQLFTSFGEKGSVKLGAGQYKGPLNDKVGPQALEAFREFRTALGAKQVSLNLREVKRGAEAWKKLTDERGGWWESGKGMTVEQAEALWPTYRDYMLTGVPDDAGLLDWAEASGVNDALRDLVKAIAFEASGDAPCKDFDEAPPRMMAA
jgi:hypothetical protein